MRAPTTDSAMYQTMHRQPDDLRRLLDTGWQPARRAAELLAGARRVIVTGVGTSYHAAGMGGWLLSAAGHDARAVLSYDLALYPEIYPLTPDDAVIVMAHTGTKQYSSRAIERAAAAGATVISVGSLTAEHPGSRLVLRTVERERSAAFTSSHLAAMTVLAQVAIELGERSGSAGVTGFRDALMELPEQVADVLAREDEILPVAREAVRRRVYVAGAGPNAISATEAVIKVREAAYGWIDALPLEQFLHGPMVAVNEDDLVVLIRVAGQGDERAAQAAAVFDGLGARLWLIGKGAEAAPAASVFELPETLELISPLLTVVPLQILAYQMAVEKGVNPDTFRRDDPRYAGAFGRITL